MIDPPVVARALALLAEAEAAGLAAEEDPA